MFACVHLQEWMFEAFREFFEDTGIKKVWHNYSFDRHVMYHHVRASPRNTYSGNSFILSCMDS